MNKKYFPTSEQFGCILVITGILLSLFFILLGKTGLTNTFLYFKLFIDTIFYLLFLGFVAYVTFYTLNKIYTCYDKWRNS